MAERILDPDDTALDPFRAMRDKDRRAGGGGFIVESPRCVARFLGAVREGRYAAERVLGDPGLAAGSMEIAEELGVPVIASEESVMTAASGYRFHAGCLAVGRRLDREPSIESLLDRLPTTSTTIVVLAGITSMDNMGGIFRTVAALGGDAVVLDGACSDPLLRRTIRISMGQVFRVPWAVVTDLRNAIEMLRSDRGFTSIGLENLPDARPISEWSRHATPPPLRRLIVIGNEGHGLAPEILASCDEVRRIEGPEDLPLDERPGGDDERSLNAATAAAIALHHLLRG